MARKKAVSATETAAPNYGDCALHLPPEWSRLRLASGHDFMRSTVGHENGIADLHLQDDPGKAHQFAWCDPKDTDRRDYLRSEKYEWVKGGGDDGPWIKNPELWEWDAEGYVWHKGQRAMARSQELYVAAMARQAAIENQRRNAVDDVDEKLLKLVGKLATDENGRPLTEVLKDQRRKAAGMR